MSKFFYLFSEGVKNIWRHKMTALTAMFSLFIALFIVGILATAGNNTYKLLHYLRSKYKVEIFFTQNISNERAIGLIHKIKKVDGVRNATIIEKEDAVRIFKDQFGENIVELLGYNPLPVSAVVNIDRNRRDPLSIEPIIKKIKMIPNVEEIRYQGNLINKIERNYKKIVDYLPYLSSIVVIIAILIIYNTIKLSVYSRKDLIETLQLVGASSMFIKLPFIIEGMIIGTISAILVFPALFVSIKTINYFISNFSSMGMQINFDPFVLVWILMIVIVISLIGSYRAASRFLK
tara:strand:+ start:603 stop:1475 length:873 start_codon:yes stop_codon:yes gene_type:complete